MEKALDLIAYGIARVLIACFARLPLATSLRIGDAFGKGVFYLSGKRRVAYVNLRNALGERLTPRARWKAVRDHYGLMAQNIVEIMSFPKLTPAHIGQNIRIHGLEKFEALAKSGKGGVLLTGHFGNWELLQVVAGLRGTPIHVLARDQKYPRLNELLNKLRETHGSVAVSRGAGIRSLVRALKEGKLIGVLADQSAGKTEGIILPFFGIKTSVPTGAFELAVRTGSLLMPCYMVRVEHARHEIFVGDVLRDDPSATNEERIESVARQYLASLEEFISKYPGQWLWENKRWKYSWSRRILILSDGKAGHFKQSDVVAGMMSSLTEFHDRPGLEFETVKAHIEYRSAGHRSLLFALAPLMRPWIQGRLNWLAPFLTEESYRAIENARADFIVTAGSSLAPVQQLLARETGAKTVVIMKPPFPYALMPYDLAVVPAHDEGPVPKRTFRSVIMPSGYRAVDRSGDVAALKAKVGDISRIRIAVFLGGKTRGYDIMAPDAEKIAMILRRLSRSGLEYMVTTSRRTTKNVEQFLKNVLSRDPACRYLVVANEENPPYAAGGMMGLADLIIVTEDSLAMISEAVGSGKRVIVLVAGQGDLPAKHYRFHQTLSQRGLVTLCCLEDLERTVAELLNKAASPVIDREKNALLQKLGELL